ncbi:hypothetical protein [Liquorilactobacillus uvarum]|nr:hypothetical protein [Liquorilactobacillus uvarum]
MKEGQLLSCSVSLGYEDKATILKLWQLSGVLGGEKDRKTSRVR